MPLIKMISAAALLAALTTALPASAEPGHGKGGERHQHPCPPGLAKKSPACVPPGQARQYEQRYGRSVGELLRVGDYVLIRDPRRYNLEQRDGWRYYREGEQVYRVDERTQKILAVLRLAQAFLN